MRKYLLTFGIPGTLIFLGLFIYFYKTSGKFRKSIIAAFTAAIFYLSALTPAHSAGEADAAFTQQNQQHQSRPRHRSGFFSGRSSNDGSGPGKPDDFDSDSGKDDLPRIAPKLQENPVGRNNPGQESYRSSISMDKLANSLSPEYSEFQSKYYSESLPKRFDTNNYSAREFKELAKDPRVYDGKYDRVSIDEARTIVQAKLENLVIKPTRPDMETARRVDLDYEAQGPAPFTHFDVKNPVGSEILKKQGQTISLKDMSYKIGQQIVAQKHRFVGLENGPVGPENVGHIVDLCYVPSSEKTVVKQNILQGAVDKGSDAGIIFLNDI